VKNMCVHSRMIAFNESTDASTTLGRGE